MNGVMWSDVDGGFLEGWWWLQWICGGELAEEIGGGYGMRKKDVQKREMVEKREGVTECLFLTAKINSVYPFN